MPPPPQTLQLHKQRIKHLLFEHQAEAVDKQGDGKVVLKLAQEAQADSERELKADTRDLKVGGSGGNERAPCAPCCNPPLPLHHSASIRMHLQVVLKELETSHDDLVRAMRQEQDRVITDLRLREYPSGWEVTTVKARVMAVPEPCPAVCSNTAESKPCDWYPRAWIERRHGSGRLQ